MMRAMYVSSAEVGATVPVGAPGVPHECSMHAHTQQRQAGAVDGTPQVTINRPRQINENSFFAWGQVRPVSGAGVGTTVLRASRVCYVGAVHSCTHGRNRGPRG